MRCAHETTDMRCDLSVVAAGKLVLNLDEVMEVLAGACHLQMRSAVDLCADFLESELCAKTCVDILNIAETYSLSKVSTQGHSLSKVSTHRARSVLTVQGQYSLSKVSTH